MASQGTAKVYRLRNLPLHVDRLAAAELVADCFGDVSPTTVRVSSLAHTINAWARTPTKTATLTFTHLPSILRSDENKIEWTLPVHGLPQPLLLDHCFQGLTPLNEVNSLDHQYDCIVISGLGSHPFGSWQRHGWDKSFMWIRDELARYFPTIRFVVYGYDTTLSHSSSFQTVSDLAGSLINTLRAEGWTSPAAKPILFLAHSLGGIVLKQALLMLAGSGYNNASIANLIKGVIFFGVPSQGMNVDDILNMIGAQPNKDALVAEISTTSDYLPQLERQFCGISFIRNIKLYWAYETKVSRTLISTNGTYHRSGPHTIMVPKESATGGRCSSDPSVTIQIDESHSDMVKFGENDARIRVIASKIANICGITSNLSRVSRRRSNRVNDTLMVMQSPDPDFSNEDHKSSVSAQEEFIELDKGSISDPLFWDSRAILQALHVPERDGRFEGIETQAEHTFEWVFDDSDVGLTRWLQRGHGIFWIRGKPGSGKSTVMKFIYRDSRTSQLLHRWRAGNTRQIMASFFFHYRGSSTQKSFQGLLKSIISQILETEPSLMSVVECFLEEEYLEQRTMKGLKSLHWDIYNLLHVCQARRDLRCENKVEEIIEDQIVPHSLQKIFGAFLDQNFRGGEEVEQIRDDLLRHQKDLKDKDSYELRELATEIWRRGTELPINDEFCGLVASWQGLLDLDQQIRDLLILCGVRNTNRDPCSDKIRFLPEWERQIVNLVLRNGIRNTIRCSIQDSLWSNTRLERLLHKLCHQELFDLDLCLLLDALDEHDGSPEFIAGFLKDLTLDSSFPATRVRILFSSRPWNIFLEEFESMPGFNIHDHTSNDIRNYCLATISQNHARQCIFALVGDIIHRSRGVFLWVRLVLRDLFEVAERGCHGDAIIEAKLRETLDRFPDELDEYYTAIVNRIPAAHRWDAYVILECLARSQEALTARDLVDIVACSVLKNWRPVGQIAWPPQTFDAERFMRRVTTGLVDVSGTYVQLMHQTVKDFVYDPQFRYIVLGLSSARAINENGHSFLAKYFLICSRPETLNAHFVYHARESERTTGISQYQLFVTAPPLFYHQKLHSSLELAASAGLHLCLDQAYQADRDVFAKFSRSPISLIRSLTIGISSVVPINEGVKMAQFIVARGYPAEEDSIGWNELFSHIWSSVPSRKSSDDFIKLALHLSTGLKGLTGSIRSGSTSDGFLHISPLALAEQFLRNGTNPNILNSRGCSPIDYILSSNSIHPSNPRHVYKMCLLFAKHGGRLNQTKRDLWDLALQHFQTNGLDVELLTHLGMPRWMGQRH